MNNSNNSLAVYDHNESLELAGNNEELANELFNMLVKELPVHKQKIEHAGTNHDFENLKQFTHKLHGACSYCGVPQLRASAFALENIISFSESVDIDKEIKTLITALDSLINYAKNTEC